MRQYIALAIRYAPITITKQQLNLKQYPSRLRRGHWSTVKMRSDASKLMFLLSNGMMIRRNPGQSMGWRPLMAINPCLQSAAPTEREPNMPSVSTKQLAARYSWLSALIHLG